MLGYMRMEVVVVHGVEWECMGVEVGVEMRFVWVEEGMELGYMGVEVGVELKMGME